MDKKLFKVTFVFIFQLRNYTVMRLGFFKAFLLLSLLISCSAQKAAQGLINKDAVPTDLTSPQYVLLVLKLDEGGASKAENKRVEKEVSKFKYPAIAVTKQELASGKFDDVNKYRYLLRAYDNPQKVNSGIVSNTRRGMNSYFLEAQYEFHFTDRKEKRDLPSTGYKSAYSRGLYYVFAYFP